MSTVASAATEAAPWHAAFPEPRAVCPQLEDRDVKSLLEQQSSAGQATPRDFLLVDVRRTDWEGGTISTSINLPAHTFYQTRPIIHQLCKQAGVARVITYCGSSQPLPLFPARSCAMSSGRSRIHRGRRAADRQAPGSSNGRGPRCAAWLQDYFDDIGETHIEALVLKGGIKGWVKKYGGDLMDWYDEKVWIEPPKCPDRQPAK